MSITILPGTRIQHREFGQGAVLSVSEEFATVFFSIGEKQIPLAELLPALSRNETVVLNVGTGEERLKKAWLCYKAHELPLLDNATSMTAARIDLLPHQVVLTHKIAIASPRRFLIADEVGLGKTIETALVLRELASRGELNRALMVVPAGLVNNWHRELNEVFNLNFEVFGSEGDVSDRKTNAFKKHDLLIASIDTLKRPERLKKILAAPKWDLVVFDEAHHCSAYRQGGKTKRTQNYKLAEALRDHTRDLILLSATPHQGDHYRFWKLIQLLDPSLFKNELEMVEERHRLNPIVFRRTKADACRSDGSTLFARRWVNTEAFIMSDSERQFYQQLNEYLRDGFALAKKQGSKGAALGFVMTIFQKIAASSFAAVHRTLRRRLIALTVHEGLVHDENLDIDKRDEAFNLAKSYICQEFQLGNDQMSMLEAERILNELKRKQLKKINEEELRYASGTFADELTTQAAEDAAMNAVEYALPEERQRIMQLLEQFPDEQETKVGNLINALGILWEQNPKERVVIFATYLGTVELLGKEIEHAYPGQGVVVLKGGDHGSKTSAEKRFKQPAGPRVMICTAAGREGINLQHSRILFNFDLPWNPMDMEQRIGRIHRYGQKDTAQVYNLVLGDTIEGKIFLLLDKKLKDIALALGKVDEQGNVAEDLRSQILGQLQETINYQKLYAEALSDPSLKRTQLELDAAMANANEARDAVSELFQELDQFSLDEYKPLSNVDKSMQQLINFTEICAKMDKGNFVKDRERYVLTDTLANKIYFSTDREQAFEHDNIEILGLDHPLIEKWLRLYRNLPAEEIACAVSGKDLPKGFLTIWEIETHNDKGHIIRTVITIGMKGNGERLAALEGIVDDIYFEKSKEVTGGNNLLQFAEILLEREVKHRGQAKDDKAYSAKLIGWLEVS
ncbi:DEAD/DEAH box helicase [bacterium]|nr:DEAD/DEAH box helicase [bacterium]